MSQCQRCAALAEMVQQKQAEINRLQRIMAEARGTASSIISEADSILSQHQPRGKWAFAKGARKAAESVYRRLAC